VVIAGLAGITPDYLYQIERGQKVPTVAVLTQLADVLRVSVGELLGTPERGLSSTGVTPGFPTDHQDHPRKVPVESGPVVRLTTAQGSGHGGMSAALLASG
jgi:Helix-turn-helix domain